MPQRVECHALASDASPPGAWLVFKGESFDLWTPDASPRYAWVNSERAMPHLDAKRKRARHSKSRPCSEFADDWLTRRDALPCRPGV
jgi:hypothetical protein